MRLKLSTLCLFTIISAMLVQESRADFFCDKLNIGCPKTTTPPVPSESASASVMPSPSSIRPPSSSAPSPIPSPTSIVPSPKPSSIVSSAAPTSISSIASSTASPSLTSDVSSTTSSPSASPTPSSTGESSGSSNLGVIIGSVCGFIAIIGAGFAYAFFSKTRKNNRNKRLYSENGDGYNDAYQPDPFSQHSRPSPALAASAAVAANNIHGNSGQWDHQQGYNYGNMAPQTPMATVAKQHDPYYSTGPAQMGYANDPNMNGYYNNNYQQYYEPNAAYYDQQQHYDHNYVDSQKQQYDAYSVPQHQSPVLNHNNTAPAHTATTTTTSSNVYSSPHSYPDESVQHSTNGNSYR